MFTEDKITEIFCMTGDFCKFFDAMMAKYTIKECKKRKYHRNGTYPKALDTQLVLFLIRRTHVNLYDD